MRALRALLGTAWPGAHLSLRGGILDRNAKPARDETQTKAKPQRQDKPARNPTPSRPKRGLLGRNRTRLANPTRRGTPHQTNGGIGLSRLAAWYTDLSVNPSARHFAEWGEESKPSPNNESPSPDASKIYKSINESVDESSKAAGNRSISKSTIPCAESVDLQRRLG